jgi:hypothetical protein
MTEGASPVETWHPALLTLVDNLRDRGYDIEPSPAAAGPIRDIVARRDLGDRAVMLAVDASGRFRAAITWVVGEWPSRDAIAGVPVRVVDAVSRAVTVTGEVESLEQILAVLDHLDANAPWASVANRHPAPSGDSC